MTTTQCIEACIEAVERLVTTAADAEKSEDALRLAQAACAVAGAMQGLEQLMRGPGAPVTRPPVTG